jgi:hypothetical protein
MGRMVLLLERRQVLFAQSFGCLRAGSLYLIISRGGIIGSVKQPLAALAAALGF